MLPGTSAPQCLGRQFSRLWVSEPLPSLLANASAKQWEEDVKGNKMHICPVGSSSFNLLGLEVEIEFRDSLWVLWSHDLVSFLRQTSVEGCGMCQRIVFP